MADVLPIIPQSLKKNRFDLFFPVIGSIVVAFLVSMLVTGNSHSISRIAGVFSIVLVATALSWYGIPPFQVVPKFHALLWLCTFLASALCAFFMEARHSWWVGLLIAFATGLCAVTCVVKIALHSFKQLPEIQQIGDYMIRKSDTSPLVSHATDVHVTVADDVARIEGGIGGHKNLKHWLMSANLLHTRYFVVSGDITDTGHRMEWQRIEESINPNLCKFNFIIAPGNHDISSQYGWPSQDKLRLYFKFQARLCPSLTTPDNKKLTDLLAKAEQEIEPLLDLRAEQEREDFISLQKAPSISHHFNHPALFNQRVEIADKTDWKAHAKDILLNEWFERKWYDLFPLRLDEPEKETLILVLNSVIPSIMTLGGSALGSLGEGQMARIKAIFEVLPLSVRNILVVTHHAPFRHAGEWQLFSKDFVKLGGWKKAISRIQEFALLSQEAQESRRFLNIISDAADRFQSTNFILFCGHRHSAAAGRSGRVISLEGNCLSEENTSAWLVYVNDGLVHIYQDVISDL